MNTEKLNLNDSEFKEDQESDPDLDDNEDNR
jgi:hypothetical protein